MRKLKNAFLNLNPWLKFILIFCLLGALVNAFLLAGDVRSGGLLLRLHLGFFILYAAQVVFILWGERMVGVLSLLQALLALCSNADYTFSLLVRFVGRMYYSSHVLTVQEISVYKYVFVSACFTLELFKTYLMFALLPAPQKATADLKTTQP